jgi:hypothetical protein
MAVAAEAKCSWPAASKDLTSIQPLHSANRRFQFQKRCQLFIGLHNVTLSVVTMRVSNPDCSPLTIKG